GAGINVGILRPITVYRFPTKEFDRIKHDPKVKSVLTVELNMGQMTDDVKLALECKKPVELLRHTGGIVPTPKEVYAKLCEINGGIRK
ncbi:MAG: 3-methyl-2-oxobutanoate dehydrogenase subunit beta, partial [Clostridia bacterium]|nr:3-methyl-2-oxobutanoate dehydrogenase subunit beta [Clostridia bacterium]